MNSILMTCLLACSISQVQLEVNGPASNPIAIPIELKDSAKSLDPSFSYVVQNGETSLPLQYSSGWYFVLPSHSIPESGQLKLDIIKGKKKANNQSQLRFEKRDQKHLDLLDENGAIWTYNYGVISREGVPTNRNRSCYFHPIYNIDGQVMTDDFPEDHYHHRGLYFSWPGLIIDGKKVDIWHLTGIKPQFEKWLYNETGPVCAKVGIQNGWYMGDKRVAEEHLLCTTYINDDNGRVMDITYRLKAIGVPISMSGTKDQNKGYGGLYFRVPPGENKAISSETGLLRRDSNRVEMPWVDYSGKFLNSERFHGGSIFIPQSHPNFPPGWTIRYYGTFGVAWPGLQEIILNPGDEPIELNYRVWLHPGDVEEGKVREAYDAYTLTSCEILTQ